MMEDRLLPEIKDGFSFSCQRCGRCCGGAGDGFVFLYDKELLQIAKKLRISVQECVTKYVEVINSEYKIYAYLIGFYHNKLWIGPVNS